MLLWAKLINTVCGLLERKKQNNKDLKICPSPRGNFLTQCWVTSLMELFEMQIFERKGINKLCPASAWIGKNKVPVLSPHGGRGD